MGELYGTRHLDSIDLRHLDHVGGWNNGVPISTSDVVIGSSANNTTVTSAANATVNTIMINTGDQLDITNGSTFTDTNASAAGGTFGVVDLDTANFVIGNGVYDNSGNFTFNSMTAKPKHPCDQRQRHLRRRRRYSFERDRTGECRLEYHHESE